MKLKSVVFTVAFAAASSVFADNAYLDMSWFATNSTQTASIMPNGTFDTLLTSPIVITNDTTYSGTFTLDSYRITAYMTNLVVHASLPGVPRDLDSLTAKGAVCAVSEDNNWYGLRKKASAEELEWAALDKKVAAEAAYAPADGGSYIFVTTVSAKDNTVDYEVWKPDNTLVASNSSTFATLADHGVVPSRLAFAGTGAYTNLVAEFIVSIANSTAVEVDGGMIAVSDGASGEVKSRVTGSPNTEAANGLKNWVNYVLGIDEVSAATKPYAAPVQNSAADKLTFSLGGVNVRGKTSSGAMVEYTIERKGDVSWEPLNGKSDVYKSHSENYDVDADPSKVNYYRIKIRIDPVH
jgi:hypothetical protein